MERKQNYMNEAAASYSIDTETNIRTNLLFYSSLKDNPRFMIYQKFRNPSGLQRVFPEKRSCLLFYHLWNR